MNPYLNVSPLTKHKAI